MAGIDRIRRRSLASAALLAAATAGLGSCGSGRGSGRQQVHFTFSKREAISFMSEVVAEYNESQDQFFVELDTSGPDAISASFVRGNPPDLMLANHNFEIARFIERCAVSDLSDTSPAAKTNSDLIPLMDQYGVCEGQVSAIPYSVMVASVIYNKEIFAEHDLEVPTTWTELIEVCDT